jgi:hypothetical protein
LCISLPAALYLFTAEAPNPARLPCSPGAGATTSHVAAFGTNPERRRRLEGQFAALFEWVTEQAPICAVQNGTIVGVTGIAPPGR